MGKIFVNITIAFGFLPLLIFLFRRTKRKHNEEIKAVMPFLWLLFVGSVYELIFSVILYIPTAYWFTLYALLEFLVMYYFFNSLFKNKYRVWFKSSLIIYTLAWLISLLFWQQATHLKTESYFIVAETLFAYIFSILWFKELFKKAELTSLWQSPLFYFICGILLYLLGSVFMFLLIYDIKKTTGIIQKFWTISLIFNILMRVLLIVGIWKATEPKRTLVKG